MDKETIQKLKKKLLQKKKELEKVLKEIATKDKVVKGDYDAKFFNIGRELEENALEVGTYDLNLSLEANLEVALAATNRALEKIKKSTYGICEKCSKEIKPKRLEAFPQARFCIDCKKKLGKGIREVRGKWARM